MGSSGSQTTFNNGRALIAAAGEMREKLLEIAAAKLEAAPQDIELVDGAARVRGAPTRNVPLADLAPAAFGDCDLLVTRADATPLSVPDHLRASCAAPVGFPAFGDPTFLCPSALAR